MDMLKHIPSGFSGRATRRPAKSARPARVAPMAYGGRPAASLRASPDAPEIHGASGLARCTRNPWGIALRPAPSETAFEGGEMGQYQGPLV